MNLRRATPQVVMLLFVLGTACVVLRMNFRHEAYLDPGDSIWSLNYTASLHARKAGAELRASLPESTQYCRVIEHTINSDLTASPRRLNAPKNKHDIHLHAPKAGQYSFTAQFKLHLSPRGGWRPDQADNQLSAEDRARFLRLDEPGVNPNDAAIVDKLAELSEDQSSREELMEQIWLYCVNGIVAVDEYGSRDATSAIVKGTACPLGQARALVALCRAAKIPARLVTGFEIQAGAAQPRTWVEIYVSDQWESFDPRSGYRRTLPQYFLPVRRDASEMMWVKKDTASDFVSKFSFARLPPPPGTFDLSHKSAWSILDLNRLPAGMHEAIEVILLLPLGGLVTAFSRTIVGVRTFGTFTPTLLALSFVYNDWKMGIIVFFAVMVIGFVSRTFLDRLKLLLVPRLGIILTLVVLCMVFGISIFNYFTPTTSGQAVLLPMVILTMLVERFYVTSEEDSVRFSAQLLAGTLAMAFIVFLLLRWKTVGHLMFVYPELHFFTVAILVLIGRYTGYRLTELWRFRDLAQAKESDA